MQKVRDDRINIEYEESTKANSLIKDKWESVSKQSKRRIRDLLLLIIIIINYYYYYYLMFFNE